MNKPAGDTPVYVEKTDPQERRRQPPAGIEGWGADLDPAVRPAVPKERTPPRFIHVQSDDIEPQPRTVQVFHSIERPGLTPVFGTSTPPSGVSGLIRKSAFRYGENDLRHWLMLLFADRVNVVEGIVDDLSRGHVPNLFKEMGGPAEWRHNRQGFLRKAMVAGAVVGVLLAMNSYRKRR
ncbi:MAG TPA: hypothetical protein VF522_03570 [Ramlibacter sp.]|uniref:hypothetical protein n=1 Tax=Ramlibacter sp. TaxID=1917967 RepID=UPI002ED11ED9